MHGYKWLEIVPGKRGGRPVIKGTRIAVDDILEALSSGWSIEEVVENYRIAEEAVREAIKYALEKLRKLEVVTV
ncbi:MAG: DUF433 domain-containing protein [Desulfurococcaceae archaeon]